MGAKDFEINLPGARALKDGMLSSMVVYHGNPSTKGQEFEAILPIHTQPRPCCKHTKQTPCVTAAFLHLTGNDHKEKWR